MSKTYEGIEATMKHALFTKDAHAMWLLTHAGNHCLATLAKRIVEMIEVTGLVPAKKIRVRHHGYDRVEIVTPNLFGTESRITLKFVSRPEHVRGYEPSQVHTDWLYPIYEAACQQLGRREGSEEKPHWISK